MSSQVRCLEKASFRTTFNVVYPGKIDAAALFRRAALAQYEKSVSSVRMNKNHMLWYRSFEFSVSTSRKLEIFYRSGVFDFFFQKYLFPPKVCITGMSAFHPPKVVLRNLGRILYQASVFFFFFLCA